ncbi:MAG: hydroxyisourate hydrolase [Pseudomonadota bacterium]
MAGPGGYLTTHVLDTARGRPGRGITIRLYRLEGDARTLLSTVTTNDDGRTDAPVIAKGALEVAIYELVFDVAAYQDAAGGVGTDATPFLEDVPIRFRVADADAHYHVPLLISPFGYATYRGS